MNRVRFTGFFCTICCILFFLRYCILFHVWYDKERIYRKDVCWMSAEIDYDVVTSDTWLSSLDNLCTPLSFYGGYHKLNIDYISDIHLLHHFRNSGAQNIKSFIRSVVVKLYATMSRDDGVIIFAGDVSSDANITIEFYRTFVCYFDYLSYKREKKLFLRLRRDFRAVELKRNFLAVRLKKFQMYLDVLQQELSSYTDKDERRALRRTIQKRKYRYAGVKRAYDDVICRYNQLSERVADVEAEYGMPIDKLTVKDVYRHHHLLSDSRHILAVLGNHEYIGFNSVQDALSFYDVELSKLGIRLLKNDFVEVFVKTRVVDFNFVIFGGTGFARYNEYYNADTLECCNNFTRDMEIKESIAFQIQYQLTKEYARENGAAFICVSHYPVKDWKTCIDVDAIYFYGHNHQNYFHKDETEMVYADNQIGYKNGKIVFKHMSTGNAINPYRGLNDGFYETTVEDYLQFYDYIGEFVSSGLISKRCENPFVKLYVIKRDGYYGFFLVNNGSSARAKGISILNGGRLKKITKETDLDWLYENFSVVVSKYLQVLSPLRAVQEQMAKELKSLGLWGSIHGCIVDVDFYHHIMFNPLDGTMTYYYSSEYGSVQRLASFDAVLLSLKRHGSGLLTSEQSYDLLSTQFSKMKENDCFLSKGNRSYLSDSTVNSLVTDGKERRVSISDGMYGMSRRINPLQRLFTGHVLRAFDLRLIDAKPGFENRYIMDESE